MRLSIVLFVFLILGACASQPGPAPMRIGNEVAFEMLQDQYSNPFPHEDNMQVLLFADDMQPSRDVRDAMGRVQRIAMSRAGWCLWPMSAACPV